MKSKYPEFLADTVKECAERIRAARARNEESQKHLAARIGVSIATVQNWEAGRTMPSNEALKLIEKGEALKIKSRFGFDCPNDPRIDI